MTKKEGWTIAKKLYELLDGLDIVGGCKELDTSRAVPGSWGVDCDCVKSTVCEILKVFVEAVVIFRVQAAGKKEG